MLKKDLISPNKFRIILLVVFSAFCLWALAIGGYKIFEINEFISAQKEGMQQELGEKSLELWSLKITNTKVQNLKNQSKSDQWVMYATVLNLDHQTSVPPHDSILSASVGQHRKIYGLQGHPSFIIHQKDLSFWKTQLYLQTILAFGGLFIVGIFYLLIYETKYRNSKLFVTPIKNFMLSLALIFLLGMFVKWGLDFRLFNFLNTEYFLGENMPPINMTLQLVGTLILIIGIFLEQAVRLQKEQDLTI